MKQPLRFPILGVFLVSISAPCAMAADARQKIDMPPMMQEHMLGNMRDHLRVLQEIEAALAKKDLDQVADIAEQRLGLSSLEAHDAAHMAPYMPRPMQDIGTAMHRTASRLAQTAQEAAVKGDIAPVQQGLSALLQQCVACHETYRLR